MGYTDCWAGEIHISALTWRDDAFAHGAYHALESCRVEGEDEHPCWLERGVYEAIVDVAAEMQPDGSQSAPVLP